MFLKKELNSDKATVKQTITWQRLQPARGQRMGSGDSATLQRFCQSQIFFQCENCFHRWDWEECPKLFLTLGPCQNCRQYISHMHPYTRHPTSLERLEFCIPPTVFLRSKCQQQFCRQEILHCAHRKKEIKPVLFRPPDDFLFQIERKRSCHNKKTLCPVCKLEKGYPKGTPIDKNADEDCNSSPSEVQGRSHGPCDIRVLYGYWIHC